jgi:putative phage-type endonuclease
MDANYVPSESDSDDDTNSEDSSQCLESFSILEDLSESDIAEITNDILNQFDEYMEENILEISSPKFYEKIVKNVTDTLLLEWEDAGFEFDFDDEDTEDEETQKKQKETFDDELREFIEQVLDYYLSFSHIPKRSRTYTVDLLDQIVLNQSSQYEILAKKISDLQNIPQPKQKSKEWYQFRYNLLSASNIWKVFSSESQINSLIYEKCKPLVISENDSTYVNTESAMHWGNKYEPVTVMIYEAMFGTNVGEFGCIQHPKYPFVGASPDGIVIGPSNHIRYGRMVEIKNIVNREITGIPKEEYWVQTQLQMETCDLNDCDFMETRFLEYMNEESFYTDVTREYRGVILHFIDKNMVRGSQPVYKYMPIDVAIDKDTIEEWKRQLREEKFVVERDQLLRDHSIGDDSLTHSLLLTHSLTHSLTYLLTHLLTHLLLPF